MTTPTPTDPDYDAVAQGVPVAILSGTLGVGNDVATLIASIAAYGFD
jgi:hypothetical protein